MRAASGAVVVYGALALLAQRSLLAHLGHQVYEQIAPGNDCLLHVWTLAWDQHALGTQPRALCDANIFYPHARTLLYSDHLLGLALLLAPLRLVTDNVVLVHNLATLAAPVLDALALYSLALALTGSPAAAFVGGLVYGFAPLRLYFDRCQIQMLVAWWPPLVLLLARCALARNLLISGLLAGLALALQGLTGIYLTAFFLPFLLLAQLCWLRRFPLRAHARGWTGLLVGELGAALALLPFALAYRAVQRELGVSRSVVLNAILSLRPSSLPELVPGLTVGLLVTAGLLVRRAAPAYRAERGFYVAMTAGALLLALGPAVTLPAGLGTVRGPYAALLALPGFDALRVPGRLVHIALLGAAVLAAGGFAGLAARLPRRGVPLAAAAVLAAHLAEAWPPALKTIRIRPPAELDPVYAWLAAQPEHMTLVEMPLDDLAQAAARYQYASTAHWRELAIGNMGILPPVYPWLVYKLRRFPDPDVLTALRQLGVTHAVVHQPRIAPDRLTPVLAATPSPLALRYAEKRTFVVALSDAVPLSPAAPLPGHVLDHSRWSLSASHGASTAADAADGDPTTSWSSWGELEDALRRWYDPVPFLDRWWGFLGTQPAWLEVDLGAFEAVTAIELALGGTDPLGVPRLVVDSSLDGITWTRVPGEVDPIPDARALVARAAEQRFALVPPAPVSARLLRISSHGLETRVAEVAVRAR